jgi:hypothetical protein
VAWNVRVIRISELQLSPAKAREKRSLLKSLETSDHEEEEDVVATIMSRQQDKTMPTFHPTEDEVALEDEVASEEEALQEEEVLEMVNSSKDGRN